MPLELRILGEIDRPHGAFAEGPDDPVTAELLLEAARVALGGSFPPRLRRDRLLAVQSERLRRSDPPVGPLAPASFRSRSSASIKDCSSWAISARWAMNVSRSTLSPRSSRSRYSASAASTRGSIGSARVD